MFSFVPVYRSFRSPVNLYSRESSGFLVSFDNANKEVYNLLQLMNTFLRKDKKDMKTAVVYYSYTGNTRELASQKAEEEKADLFEVKEAKQRSVFSAYVFGSFSAMRQKKAAVLPVTFSLSDYDKIIVAVPIWAGSPAPAFHNILELIPAGKKVELIFTSGSGDSGRSKSKTLALAAQKGLTVTGYQDVKTAK